MFIIKRDECDILQQRINKLEALVLNYKSDIESYQEQTQTFANFKDENTCLNPLIFWSGYIAAVFIGKLIF